MRLDEYFRDPHPPPVQDLVVVGFAVVRDHRDRVLLVRRSDDGNWELPGGQVEVGETVSSAATREVAEESGISIDLTGVSGSRKPRRGRRSPDPSWSRRSCARTRTG